MLVGGGSHAEIPLIDALHRLGFTVITTGLNTDGLGHKVADLYEPIDFSNKMEMLRVAQKHDICGIVSGCNDFSYLSTAFVAEKLNLPGHDSVSIASLIHHKDTFRKLQARCGIRHPKAIVCNGPEELADAHGALRLPVVVKPIDLTGGKGVKVCHTWEAAKSQLIVAKQLTREAHIAVEEYIEGANHGTSMLLQNNSVAFAFFDNEEYFKNKYLVSGAYSPSDLSAAVKKDVVAQVEALARHLGLSDGLFHCQFIVTRDDIPFLIDPCRRAPGDLYVNLVSYATGIDYPMSIVKSELGMSIEGELAFEKTNRCIARECMMAESNGRIDSIIIDPVYESHIIEKMQWLYPGDRIENHLTEKAGIVFFEYPDSDSLQRSMSNLYQHMRVGILPD